MCAAVLSLFAQHYSYVIRGDQISINCLLDFGNIVLFMTVFGLFSTWFCSFRCCWYFFFFFFFYSIQLDLYHVTKCIFLRHNYTFLFTFSFIYTKTGIPACGEHGHCDWNFCSRRQIHYTIYAHSNDNYVIIDIFRITQQMRLLSTSVKTVYGLCICIDLIFMEWLNWFRSRQQNRNCVRLQFLGTA